MLAQGLPSAGCAPRDGSSLSDGYFSDPLRLGATGAPDLGVRNDESRMVVFVQSPNGERARLATTVAILRNPASYPNDVRTVEAIETHMSWVFLTESHAFKLKKPIRTPWLDYTTLDVRKRACETELALNRRLAPSVYLAVVPLVLSERKQLCVEQPGPASDWLVKMRRLPAERMLDAMIARRQVQRDEVEKLADVLASFYVATQRAPLDGPAYLSRIASDLGAKRLSLQQARYGLNRGLIRALAQGQERWLARHGSLLEARSGSLVDAHGDLRPEHICLEDEGPSVIDCLEFDRELRRLDPLSELSFLALECRRLEAAWIGECVLGRHKGPTQDHAEYQELIHFYASYHALVRAAVAVWHLDDGALNRSDHWRRRADQYLKLSGEFLAGEL